jgi:hypothetical protein
MKQLKWLVFGCLIFAFLSLMFLSNTIDLYVDASNAANNADDPSQPDEVVKLIFIHHSCGENWLEDGNGGLGIALRDNNYFVSDTNYSWGTDNIGDTTDIGHWWNWFRGPQSATYLGELYTESGQNSSYSRLASDPGGENQIVMFKSCYPNSYLGGDPTAPPTTGDNPLRGQPYDSGYHTVENAKGIYNDLLVYFATRQDKLFIAVTAPAQVDHETDSTHAGNARAFNDWLVEDWLDGYAHNNVAVWDFYNVLTSNGGSVDVNDLGQETGNHHRWWNGAVQHIHTVDNNYSSYPTGDSHPTSAGNQKATGEFVELLNVFYNRWQGTTGPPSDTPTPTATTKPPTGPQTVIFQQGVSPDASYAGAADTVLSNAPEESNINLGSYHTLEVWYGDGEEVRRSLMRWDISSLPADARVSAASVELYRYDAGPDADMQAALYLLTSEWTEGSGHLLPPGEGYVPDGATWNIASPGTNWTTPGGDYDTTTNFGNGPNGIVDQIALPTTLEDGWVSLDATAAVRAWVEQGVSNYGLLLRPLSGDYTYHYFHSADAEFHDPPNLRPRLVVTYTVGGDTEDQFLYLPLVLMDD